MPWESFLQVLKHMFEMTNYRGAPLAIGRFWATKSVMHYRDPERVSWYFDSCESISEWMPNLAFLAAESPLVRHLHATEKPVAVRKLSRVTRGPDVVQVGDWILVRQESTKIIACVSEMLQAHRVIDGNASNVMRLWCVGGVRPQEGQHGELTAKKPNADSMSMLVRLECVEVSLLTRNEGESHDMYTV